jgi:hypothetical protein
MLPVGATSPEVTLPRISRTHKGCGYIGIAAVTRGRVTHTEYMIAGEGACATHP